MESITKDMLQKVWYAFDYRSDVIRVTEGAHIEHLQIRLIKLDNFFFYLMYSILF